MTRGRTREKNRKLRKDSYSGPNFFITFRPISGLNAHTRDRILHHDTALKSHLEIEGKACRSLDQSHKSSPICCRRHIEVHGRPTPAVFRNKPHQSGKNSFRLVWTVDSYTRIEEYRLLYRQIKPYHPVRTTISYFFAKKKNFFFIFRHLDIYTFVKRS